jgi:hypothetical protein
MSKKNPFWQTSDLESDEFQDPEEAAGHHATRPHSITKTDRSNPQALHEHATYMSC